MAGWFWYAVVAAILYGAHQIFTRLAAERIGRHPGWRRGDHGDRRHFVLSRSAVVATTGRRHPRNRWIALTAQVKAFRGGEHECGVDH